LRSGDTRSGSPSLAATGKLKLAGEPGKLKLKGATADATAGEKTLLKLKLDAATVKKVKKSGAKRGQASVTITATDDADNVARQTESVALSRTHRK
jgi:hypothetical protein